MKHPYVRRFVADTVACLAAASLYGLGASMSHAAPMLHAVPSGDSLTLEYQDENGTKLQETLPIHQAGGIKYFSAGVGMEERSAQYPSFPLKLIFVAGPRAYLSEVSVTIKETGGTVRVEVPREQVTGPWLFVDLPPGTYEITAIGPSQNEVKERVTITAKQTKTVYLRWKGETA